MYTLFFSLQEFLDFFYAKVCAIRRVAYDYKLLFNRGLLYGCFVKTGALVALIVKNFFAECPTKANRIVKRNLLLYIFLCRNPVAKNRSPRWGRTVYQMMIKSFSNNRL